MVTASPGDQPGPTEWQARTGPAVGVGPWPGDLPSDLRYDPHPDGRPDPGEVVWAWVPFEEDHRLGKDRPVLLVGNDGPWLLGLPLTSKDHHRGAMVTDRYQHLEHHDTVAGLIGWARERGLAVVAVDNTPGAMRIERARLPRECVLLFGQEGPGVSADAQSGADLTVSIAQFGSTRSINAGVAAGIAMHAWVGQHADFDEAW